MGILKIFFVGVIIMEKNDLKKVLSEEKEKLKEIKKDLRESIKKIKIFEYGYNIVDYEYFSSKLIESLNKILSLQKQSRKC